MHFRQCLESCNLVINITWEKWISFTDCLLFPLGGRSRLKDELFDGTRAVGVAGVGTLWVFPAIVPAWALRDIKRFLTNQGFGIKDLKNSTWYQLKTSTSLSIFYYLSLWAAELVGVATEEACEEVLAVRRVGVNGMSLEETLRTDLFLTGASESFNGFQQDFAVSIWKKVNSYPEFKTW